MSYLALYRKYRPTDFNDVCGQEEIVTVLKNAVINNKISHAYLFSGPRGTGKTTIAKIIGRLVNCENLIDGNPCGKCYNCLNFINSNDIVEIDAASNNGVDEIRDLRDKVNLVPSNAKYKVYIIDEVHMLTNQAFNALLKTLEEPPAHVIFILATTEPHKIPLTIASRCQKFNFSRIDDNKIVDRLKYISLNEEINVSEDAFYEIARLSDGCMRDAINILDQLVAYGNGTIELDDVYKVNGTVSYDNLCFLVQNIINNDKISIIDFISKLEDSGNNIGKFIEEFIVFLKDIIIYRNTAKLSNIKLKNDAIIKLNELCDDIFIYNLINNLYDVLINIKVSSHDDIILMTSLLKFSASISQEKQCDDSNKETGDNKIISREIKTISIDGGDSTKGKEEEQRILKNTLSDKDINIRINNTFALASRNSLNEFKNGWKKLDEFVYDNKFSSIAGLLKDTVVSAAGDNYVIITSGTSSIVDRLNERVEDAEELLGKIFNKEIFVVILLNDDWKEKKKDYVNNVKNNVKYTLIEYVKKKEKDNNNTPIDELIDLVGDSIIEYK